MENNIVNQERKLPKALKEFGYLFLSLFVIWGIVAIWGLFLTDKSGLGGIVGFIIGPVWLLLFVAMLIRVVYAAIYDRAHFRGEVGNKEVSTIEKSIKVVIYVVVGILVLIIGKSVIKFFQ